MQSEIYEYFSGKFGTIKGDANANFDSSYTKNSSNLAQILICEDEKEAQIAKDAAEFAGWKCFVLPDFRAKFGDDLRSFYDEIRGICAVLSEFYKYCQIDLSSSNLAHKFDTKNALLIAPIHTILHKLPTPKHLQTLTLKWGEKVNLDELKSRLLSLGYTHCDIIQSEAEFSVRGDIIDIFPLGGRFAYRILLEFDEIDSIRAFDISTQKSDATELEILEITPFIASLNDEKKEQILDKIEHFNSDILVKDFASLGFWFIDDLVDFLSLFRAILSQNVAKNRANFELEKDDLSKISQLSQIPNSRIFKDLNTSLNADFIALHNDKKIRILCTNEAKFLALNLEKTPNLSIEISPLILNLISDKEIIISLNSREKKHKIRHSNLIIDELKSGDFIVHCEYGIGKFIGLERARVLGNEKEFVAIIYQNDDKLLLPVENLNMIDRYIAPGEVGALDRLGKATFSKIKEKVREKLLAIAQNIIAIAAKRELIDGKKMRDLPLKYANFCTQAGFEYTLDQKNAIEAIFSDLQSGKIMDRLLSGDVGFGKTEVAMNAIFMSYFSGFTSLFFVPTTLLSAQHFKTLKERLAPFKIPIFRYDRFTSAKEKSALKLALQSGLPLVCIGTHALLGLGELNIQNVGLIIIDEEHKFGVKQKEKLKEISLNSHLLSMSATPIPRSLNLALSSVKSYSSLLTPPIDRLDVKTFVKEWDNALIKEAIMREIRRGGQVFYVHNHIASIEQTKRELSAILPNLRILILHSKIDQKTTEDEMLNFIDKKYDVLLCTSIVESGIHIPNANTIIIDSANRFGIADLHQLRGRVGRSDRQGFCYFLIEDKNSLSKDSLKRLLALESNSFLGSGSVLAYHDLEIRGGGNILGDAQSGHIAQIGYSLYLKMLEDEINALLNKKSATLENIDLRLSVTAFLNSEFIASDRLRLELYRRLSQCQNSADVYEIVDEMQDRFGKMDIYSSQFIQVILIKVLARKFDAKLITNFENNISITKMSGEKLNFKAKSKDDDDVLGEILAFLRKNLREKDEKEQN